MRPSAPIPTLSNTEAIIASAIETQRILERPISIERSLSSVGTQVQVIERTDAELFEDYIDCSTNESQKLESITEQAITTAEQEEDSCSSLEDEDDIEVLDTVTLTEM